MSTTRLIAGTIKPICKSLTLDRAHDCIYSFDPPEPFSSLFIQLIQQFGATWLRRLWIIKNHWSVLNSSFKLKTSSCFIKKFELANASADLRFLYLLRIRIGGQMTSSLASHTFICHSVSTHYLFIELRSMYAGNKFWKMFHKSCDVWSTFKYLSLRGGTSKCTPQTYWGTTVPSKIVLLMFTAYGCSLFRYIYECKKPIQNHFSDWISLICFWTSFVHS